MPARHPISCRWTTSSLQPAETQPRSSGCTAPMCHGCTASHAEWPAPDAADELTQDVFVRVWQKLGTFRGRVGVRHVAAPAGGERHRGAVPHAGCPARPVPGRRRAGPRGHAGAGPSPARPGDGPGQRDDGAAARGADDLRAARRRGLSARGDRRTMLGISSGTSKSQLHRARQTLRGLLNRAADGPQRTPKTQGRRCADSADGADMTNDTESRTGRPEPAVDDPLAIDDPLMGALGSLQDRPPTADLWPGIAARLSAPSAREADGQLHAAATGDGSHPPDRGVRGRVVAGARAEAGGGRCRTEPAIRAVVEPAGAVQPDIQRATLPTRSTTPRSPTWSASSARRASGSIRRPSW